MVKYFKSLEEDYFSKIEEGTIMDIGFPIEEDCYIIVTTEYEDEDYTKYLEESTKEEFEEAYDKALKIIKENK